MIAVLRRREVLALPALLLVAAALRLPDLATRGTWDADQGHDMLILRALVRDGVIPLLGPPTSIGDVHHGALYYYLLAPAAALTGGDSPLAVVAWIALSGIAAVGVTWWLARSIAGPTAGLVAGLAMAISPAAVDESTFIWNPNLIALSGAVALVGAWRAWTTGRSGWWLVAAAGTAVTLQSHVLGVTLFPVIGALFVADVRRRTAPRERWALVRAGVAGLAIIALSFLPLVIHELTTNFSEVQAALAYLRTGGDRTNIAPAQRLLIVSGRVVSWPLVGLITTGAGAALAAIVGVLGLAIWRFVVATGPERVAVRWLTLGLAWSAIALSVLSPSLATVVKGLPNDHYHAFADPMVFVLVGVGAAALWRAGGRAGFAAGVPDGLAAGGRAVMARAAATAGRLVASVGLLAVIAWAVTHQPPAVAPDGGFPAAQTAAARIEAAIPQGPIEFASLPVFKTAEAYVYPLVRDGRHVDTVVLGGSPPASDGPLAVVCDSLFSEVIGAACGGPAESAAVGVGGGSRALIDRFEAAPRQTISIYGAARAGVRR